MHNSKRVYPNRKYPLEDVWGLHTIGRSYLAKCAFGRTTADGPEVELNLEQVLHTVSIHHKKSDV